MQPMMLPQGDHW